MLLAQQSSGDPAAQDKGPLILALSWVFTALGISFTGLRLFTQAAIRRQIHSEDYWCIITICSIILSASLGSLSVHYGNGRHFATLTTQQQENVVLWMMSAYVPGILSLGLGKLAVITFLIRLLVPGKLHRCVLWGSGVLCQALLAAAVCLLMLQCSPPRALWDFSVKGRCLPSQVPIQFSFVVSSLSAFMDFYLAVYPALELARLQMPLKRKLGLCSALCFGFVSGSVAIYKTTGVSNLARKDVSWDLSVSLYWTLIEANLVLTAACIPVLQPLLDFLQGRNPLKSGGERTPHQYEGYSEQNRPTASIGSRKKHDKFGFTIQEPDSIEMSTGKLKKKRDKYGFTIQDPAESRLGTESEEHIVSDGNYDTEMDYAISHAKACDSIF